MHRRSTHVAWHRRMSRRKPHELDNRPHHLIGAVSFFVVRLDKLEEMWYNRIDWL